MCAVDFRVHFHDFLILFLNAMMAIYLKRVVAHLFISYFTLTSGCYVWLSPGQHTHTVEMCVHTLVILQRDSARHRESPAFESQTSAHNNGRPYQPPHTHTHTPHQSYINTEF